MMTWEERMSAKHRPTYPTDPVPMRRPNLRERFHGARFRWLPWLPILLCRRCYKFKGRWVLHSEPNDWRPTYQWGTTCNLWNTPPNAKRCSHRHHSREVWFA